MTVLKSIKDCHGTTGTTLMTLNTWWESPPLTLGALKVLNIYWRTLDTLETTEKEMKGYSSSRISLIGLKIPMMTIPTHPRKIIHKLPGRQKKFRKLKIHPRLPKSNSGTTLARNSDIQKSSLWSSSRSWNRKVCWRGPTSQTNTCSPVWQRWATTTRALPKKSRPWAPLPTELSQGSDWWNKNIKGSTLRSPIWPKDGC